jgi:hypothetical protein
MSYFRWIMWNSQVISWIHRVSGASQDSTDAVYPSIASRIFCPQFLVHTQFMQHFLSMNILSTFVHPHLLFMSMGWDYVSELQPLMGLLFIPQMIYKSVKPWWNYTDRGKPKNSEKTCPSATLSTTNPTWTDLGLCGERPATNCLSHGTAYIHT